MSGKQALILGSGSHYGIAFHLSVLRGLQEEGINLNNSDYIVGTSAGSQVSTTISSDLDWEIIWNEQIIKEVNEVTPISDEDMKQFFEVFESIPNEAQSIKKWIDEMGKISQNTPKIILIEDRKKMIRERFGSISLKWNDKLNIVATELETSERIVFNKDSGVELIDALMASSALQGVWQPIPINEFHYYDGGSYSMENPDVISDAKKMIVFTTNLPIPVPYELDYLVEKLKKEGKRVFVVKPDNTVIDILKDYGFNTMNSDLRESVAHAALKQGRSIAGKVKAFLN
ncbi:patatin-like phospholipase family protein [Staphylococcus sp. GSSP0090]|nr:patatin-like phospholipase family protein [Staphylococcus sp. GSSP0090]